MEQNNRSFILAIILSIGVLFLWQVFYAGPKHQKQAEQQKAQQADPQSRQTSSSPDKPRIPDTKDLPNSSQTADIGKSSDKTAAPLSRQQALSSSQRIEIDTPQIKGSIALKGARIDDIVFRKHFETVAKNSPNVTIFSPSQSPDPYYADHGWLADSNSSSLKLPDDQTVWKAEDGAKLTSSKPVVLTYDNGAGLVFKRTISIDDHFMISIQQSVENKGSEKIILYPYALLSRHGIPKTEKMFVLHEGLAGYIGQQNTFHEIHYADLVKGDAGVAPNLKGKGGWLGFKDKYWAAVIIPDQSVEYTANFKHFKNDRDSFQTEYLSAPVTIEAGKSAQVTDHVYVGIKQAEIIKDYENKFNITKFDLMIDWGLFAFLTKPFYLFLHYIYTLVGNFGIAILIMTICIKLLMFPLANKSYVAMSKMKLLQPEMQRVRERFKDDRVRQQQAMMELYKKEKINPMAGCLPIFIQIPVFFALYKVIYISVDMRHAPFFGWIRDLSAPDPTTLFNLFGLIPWDPPSMLMIGIWPLLMGISMWVQMKLNPQQADPIQQQIFNWMPLIFTFLLAPFAAGLVIYWTWNNILSVAQQWIIMARQGVKVDLFENLGLKKTATESGVKK